jgi:hypothetical protein
MSTCNCLPLRWENTFGNLVINKKTLKSSSTSFDWKIIPRCCSVHHILHNTAQRLTDYARDIKKYSVAIKSVSCDTNDITVPGCGEYFLYRGAGVKFCVMYRKRVVQNYVIENTVLELFVKSFALNIFVVFNY